MSNPNLPARFEGADFNKVLEPVLSGMFIRAVQYVSPKFIVRATRTRAQKKIDLRRNASITLTLGSPNYLEREFIKDCKKSGEPFPVKRVQVKLYNPPKKKLTKSK